MSPDTAWSVKFEPTWHDAWVGLFWKRKDEGEYEATHAWVCLLPFLAVHVTRWRKR